MRDALVKDDIDISDLYHSVTWHASRGDEATARAVYDALSIHEKDMLIRLLCQSRRYDCISFIDESRGIVLL